MKLTNVTNLPRSWVNVVRHMYDVDPPSIKSISATTLEKTPRMRLLTIRHWDELEMDVVEAVHTTFGTAMHYVAAQAQDDDYIAEKRLSTIVAGKIFTGKPDLYDIKTDTIEDYKTASVWSYIFNMDKWVKQLNVYRWLEHEVNNRLAKKLIVVAYFKDWSKLEFSRHQDYPTENLMKTDVEVWPLAKTGEYITRRIKIHKKYEATPDDQLPLCTKEERWATDSIYAVHKVVNGKAATRATNARSKTQSDAEAVIKQLYAKHPNDKYVIQYRPGMDKRCLSYCIANIFCPYYKAKYLTGGGG